MDLCSLLGIDSNSIPTIFLTNQGRVESRSEVAKLLKPKFEVAGSSELLEKIHRKKIPAGIIQNVKEAMAMPGLENIFIF